MVTRLPAGICRIVGIGVKNFKSLRNIWIDITSSPIVLIGGNGSGKTSLVEAIQLFKLILDWVRGRIANPFSQWWGYNNVVWNHDENLNITLTLKLECDIFRGLNLLKTCSENIDDTYMWSLCTTLYQIFKEIKNIVNNKIIIEYKITISGKGGRTSILQEKLRVEKAGFELEHSGNRLKIISRVTEHYRTVEELTRAITSDMIKNIQRYKIYKYLVKLVSERELETIFFDLAKRNIDRIQKLRNFLINVYGLRIGILDSYVQAIRNLEAGITDFLEDFIDTLFSIIRKYVALTIGITNIEKDIENLFKKRLKLAKVNKNLIIRLREIFIRSVENILGVDILSLNLISSAMFLVGACIDKFVILRQLDYRKLREPQRLEYAESLEPNGSNLLSYLYQVSGGNIPGKILGILERVWGVDRIDVRFRLTPDSRVMLIFNVNGLQIPQVIVPDGIWKALAIETAILGNASLIVIDEFENSLHAFAQELLVEELRRNNVPAVLTTHSPVPVDVAGDPANVILLEFKNNETRIVRVKDREGILKKLEELGLTLSESFLYGFAKESSG